MKIKELATALENDPIVNKAEDQYISFISRAKPDHWNYQKEAQYLLRLLEALEAANLIKIIGKGN